MKTDIPSNPLWFDPQDYDLLRIVNDVLKRGVYPEWKRVLESYLHPHGIKELAASKGLRIAHAVIHLLGSLERGEAGERLKALRTLRDEVLLASESDLQLNTARVLLQIMKELVRAGDEPLKQLMLARDFRRAITGKPRVIRRELRKYHLLEMSEDWNQLSFDDHIHDANTKGRKSPSHLIMDAWIKGVRSLTVIHYNHVEPGAAAELLEAAEIMGVEASLGLELQVRYGDRYVKLLWTPGGVSEPLRFLRFLERPTVREFMEQGREVTAYQQQYVWNMLSVYNERLRHEIGREYGVTLPPLERGRFLEFIGVGMPSVFHLGNCIWDRLANALRTPGGETRLPDLDAEAIIDRWLLPQANPDVPNPFVPREGDDVPELLRMGAGEMSARLKSLQTASRITLNLADLTREDVLALLAECKGRITHLEIFNIRNFERGRQAPLDDILSLMVAINSGNIVRFKKIVLTVAEEMEARGASRDEGPFKSLNDLLEELPVFLAIYRKHPLGACLGSDSTGQSLRHPGMGLVVADTLPAKARSELRSRGCSRMALPLSVEVTPVISYVEQPLSPMMRFLVSILRFLPCLGQLGRRPEKHWVKGSFRPVDKGLSEVFTLGGVASVPSSSPTPAGDSPGPGWEYLNSHLKNGLKIFFGFVPAAVSFALTKDWWLLAWFGPVIWFSITGVRNIIQSVLGCGGLHRSRLLKWNDYVSWDRLADSLFYTGFSVPLLDYLVKTLLLDKGMDINTTTNPLALYTIMGLVNGIYISTHNAIRGLPRKAIFGNFFRSVLSIPVAVFCNWIIGGVLGLAGAQAVDAILQKWAAIISKFASDCVAGVIEGLADRSKFAMLRTRDLREKFRQLYNTYARLEELYPLESVVELFESPRNFMETMAYERHGLDKIVIVNALDFLYFWMYQPRSRMVLARMLSTMGPDERKAFLLSQYVLQREKEISLLLVDGLVGKHFNRALAFYLDNANEYLDQLQELVSRL